MKNGFNDFTQFSLIEHQYRLSKAVPQFSPLDVFTQIGEQKLDDERPFEYKIYRPKNFSHHNGPLPTLVYISGTAFIAHEISFTDVTCSILAEKGQCQIICIDHYLAPAVTSEQINDDIKNLFLKILSDKKKLRIDITRLMLGGYSSGGNLAAILTSFAAQRNIAIYYQLLISPIVDLSRSQQGYVERENCDTGVSLDFTKWFLSLYLSKKTDPKDPKFSPLFEQAPHLSYMPPTDILCGEYDRFFGDAVAYYKKLQELNVPVNLHIVNNTDHGLLWKTMEGNCQAAACLKAALANHFEPKSQSLLFRKPYATQVFSDELRRHAIKASSRDTTYPLIPKSRL